MPKKKRKRSNKKTSEMDMFCKALDLMLAGSNQVVTPDFILQRRDPFNADIGHLDPKALNTFNQEFVDSLLAIKGRKQISIPKNIEILCQQYLTQRQHLSHYHNAACDLIESYDIEAAKELGNFDSYLDKVVIRNEAELNVLFDYISLYRKINNKRTIVDWRLTNPHAINKKNNEVVSTFEKAFFSVLRLDRNLASAAILATDIIKEKEYILMDRGLRQSNLIGDFFICTLLDMGEYAMTSGAGIPVNPRSNAGKSSLSLLEKHLLKLRTAKRPINNNIISCVRELYGFSLRSGAMEYMTVH